LVLWLYRNNLYWAELGSEVAEASSGDKKVLSRGVFCLWYGGSDIEREDTICVLPIAPPVVVECPGPAATNLVQDLTMAVEGATGGDNAASPPGASMPPLALAGPSNGAPMSSALTPKDDGELASSLGVSPALMVHVKRSALQPLDADLVRSKYSPVELANDANAHLVIALVQFAEWDYPQRESYIWPDFMIPIMADPAVRTRYIDTAKKHPLHTGARPLSDVLLFLLAAEHIGVLEEWYHTPFLCDRQCTDNIVALLESLDEFRTSEEEVYRPFCRVGTSFEVDVTAHKLVCPREKLLDRTGAGEAAAYVPPPASVDKYLGQVQLLREKYLRVDQVIEAPVALAPFLSGLETFYKTRRAPAGYSSSTDPALHRVQLMRDLDEYIAQSRRQNRRPTSLCTVKSLQPAPPKHVTSDGASSALSVPAISSPVAGSAGLPAAAPTEVRQQQQQVVDLSAMTSVIDLTSATSSSESGSAVDQDEKLDALAAVDVPKGCVESAPPSVVVNFGAQEVRVPLSSCRLFSMPEDTALEILHACGGDQQRALERVAQVLAESADTTENALRGNNSTSSDSSSASSAAGKIDVSPACNRLVVAPTQLDRFYTIVTK
jgi:hypothetical protein